MNTLAVIAPTAAATAIAAVGKAADFPLDVFTTWLVAIPLALAGNAFVALEPGKSLSWRVWARVVLGAIIGAFVGGAGYLIAIGAEELTWGVLLAAVLGGTMPEFVLNQARRLIARRTDNEPENH